MCRTCGNLLSPVLTTPISLDPHLQSTGGEDSEWACRVCEEKGQVEVISIPYVFRYLVAELAGMNIHLKLETT